MEPEGTEQEARPTAALESPDGSWIIDQVVRGLNLSLAAASLVVSGPLMAALAILVKISSPGPVFMAEERVGFDRRRRPLDDSFSPNLRSAGRRRTNRGGRIFRAFRFRTVTEDPARAGQVWTSHGDPRITGVGLVLRKYRLDELPLLVNVLRGDLRLLGRPRHPSGILRASRTESLEPAVPPKAAASPPAAAGILALRANRRAGLDLRRISSVRSVVGRDTRSLLTDLDVVAGSLPAMTGKRSSL